MENIPDLNLILKEENQEEKLLPDTEEIINQLKSNAARKSSIWGNISLLIITVFLFLGSGLINNPVFDIFFIIIIVLIHETGHLVAMKIFGYRDVKMFFIPFFGAAVSGKHDDIDASRKAVISLAGPVPGIIIGFVLVILGIFSFTFPIYNVGILFLYLNGLNLLPLYPFDGGRFMSEVFFIRNRYMELIFKVIAVSAFLITAIELKDLILGFIAFTLSSSVRMSYKLGLLSKEIKQNYKIKFEGRLLDQKNDILNKIVSGLIKKFPIPIGKRYYENLIYDLWARIKYIPPKISSTIGLSLGYFIPLLLVILFFLYLTYAGNGTS